MNPEEIRALLRVQPFAPFRIHLSSQKLYEIANPEMVLVAARTTHIGIIRNVSPEHDLFDAVDVISNVHITQLEPIVPAA